MATEKAQYAINVRSRFRYGKSHEELYRAAAERLSQIPPRWGFKGLKIKPLPPIKKNISTGVSYTRELGAPIKYFGIGFINRESPADNTFKFKHDDLLSIDFNINHKSMDYGYLVREVLPAYVEAMEAYFMHLSEDGISGPDASELWRMGEPTSRERTMCISGTA